MKNILIIDDSINLDEITPAFANLHFSFINGQNSENYLFWSWAINSEKGVTEIWYIELNKEFNFFLIKGPELETVEQKIRKIYKVFDKEDPDISQEYLALLEKIDKDEKVKELKLNGIDLERKIIIGFHKIDQYTKIPNELSTLLQTSAEEAIPLFVKEQKLYNLISHLYINSHRGYNHHFLDTLNKGLLRSDIFYIKLNLSQNFFDNCLIAAKKMQLEGYIPYLKSKKNGKYGTCNWEQWVRSSIELYITDKENNEKKYNSAFAALKKITEEVWKIAPEIKKYAENFEFDKLEVEFSNLEAVKNKDINILRELNKAMLDSIYELIPYLSSTDITQEKLDIAWPIIQKNTFELRNVGIFTELRVWWDKK